MADSVDKTGIGRAVTRLYRRRRNTFRLEKRKRRKRGEGKVKTKKNSKLQSKTES